MWSRLQEVRQRINNTSEVRQRINNTSEVGKFKID